MQHAPHGGARFDDIDDDDGGGEDGDGGGAVGSNDSGTRSLVAGLLLLTPRRIYPGLTGTRVWDVSFHRPGGPSARNTGRAIDDASIQAFE